MDMYRPSPSMLFKTTSRAASIMANSELSGTAHAAKARAMFMNPPPYPGRWSAIGDPSPRQTSIGKISDCVMKSERVALVKGSDLP